MQTRKNLNIEYKKQCREAEQKHAENKKAAEDFYQNLK
jgi:hypothetical protein